MILLVVIVILHMQLPGSPQLDVARDETENSLEELLFRKIGLRRALNRWACHGARVAGGSA